MNKVTFLSTTIDGYRVELSGPYEMQCTVIGKILKRELKTSLKVLQATGKIEHDASGERHEVQMETIARISAWASQNGYRHESRKTNR